MFIRSCIILHNIIIRLEGGHYESSFREELYQTGWEDWNPGSDEGADLSDEELRAARRRIETPGQRFRKQVMTRLFDSSSSGAQRR